MKSLTQKLTETFAPSGYEYAMRDLIRAEVETLADDVRVDALGNLIVRKGRPGAKKIMIAAHLDEIGLIASHIDENGFVRFTTLGGVRPQNLMGGRVRFVNGTVGIMYAEPLEKPGDAPAIEKMYIDVGATSPADCPVRVGDVAGFDRPFLDLGHRMVSKTMDDRIGCVVAIDALRNLKDTPHDVYFVFTVQEEVGLRGAGVSAYGIAPDLGFSIDVTGWGDTPGLKNFPISLGKGPAIKIKDSGMLADPRVVAWMIRTAESAGIPYQREILVGGTTDAAAMQLSRAGVPVGCISIPCRYVHSPSEMVDVNDVENAIRLVVALLTNPVDLDSSRA